MDDIAQKFGRFETGLIDLKPESRLCGLLFRRPIDNTLNRIRPLGVSSLIYPERRRNLGAFPFSPAADDAGRLGFGWRAWESRIDCAAPIDGSISLVRKERAPNPARREDDD